MKPAWLKIRPPTVPQSYQSVRGTLNEKRLVTVCEEAKCPNINECWSTGTATFMVMGDTCTRGCRFCAVKTWKTGRPLDPMEPENVAQAVVEMKLDYVVITSVDRDDLPDQGAGHFAACIKAVKDKAPFCLIEVLIPDFRGDESCLKKMVDARPDVISHNIETTETLTPKVRDPRANYRQSLRVLENVKQMDSRIYTKSGIMVGLGETQKDVEQAMDDLREKGVQVLTIGQYLRPSQKQLEIREYVTPEQFEAYKKVALDKGFAFVASGPFVRSSYRAGELFLKHAIQPSGGKTK